MCYQKSNMVMRVDTMSIVIELAILAYLEILSFIYMTTLLLGIYRKYPVTYQNKIRRCTPNQEKLIECNIIQSL